MHLGGGDRCRIAILQGRNRLEGAQNNILRLIGSSLASLGVRKTAFGLVRIILFWLCYYCNAFFVFWQVFLAAIYKEIQGGAFLRRLVL